MTKNDETNLVQVINGTTRSNLERVAECVDAVIQAAENRMADLRKRIAEGTRFDSLHNWNEIEDAAIDEGMIRCAQGWRSFLTEVLDAKYDGNVRNVFESALENETTRLIERSASRDFERVDRRVCAREIKLLRDIVRMLNAK